MRLTKLFRLENTGLFLNGLPGKAIDLPRIVLIYGENGRGKTTLSEVLRSLATGRSELLEGRRSVDADGEPEVALRWEHDGDSGTIQFSDDRWSEGFGPLSVYDAPWVHENVHTGELLEPSHRDALLELALGSAAVTAKRAVEQANTSARDAKKEANAKRKTVEAYARPYTVEDFVKLDPEEDRSAEMERAQQELVNVRKADSIRRRPRPRDTGGTGRYL